MRSCLRSNSISGWGRVLHWTLTEGAGPSASALSYLVRPRPDTCLLKYPNQCFQLGILGLYLPPYRRFPKRGREKEGEAKCSDLQWDSCPPGMHVQDSLALSLGESVPAAGWSRETNVRPPWRGVCLGGAPPHPAQGLDSSCPIESLDPRLTPARIQPNQHDQATIILRNGLKT